MQYAHRSLQDERCRTLEKLLCENVRPSRRMANLTSHEATMFWILKSMNLAGKPSFWMMRAYLRAARRESSSSLAPVHTILPDAKMSAVVLGSRIRMMTAAKRCGRRGTAFPQRERGAGELVHHTYDTISSRHAPRKHRSHNRATAAGGARYLGVVFGVTGMQGNVLQIEPAAEVDGRHDVPVIARHRGECHSEEEERASGRECGHTVAWG